MASSYLPSRSSLTLSPPSPLFPPLCLLLGHLSPIRRPPGWSPSLLIYIALIWASGPWITYRITDWKASRSISLCLYWHSTTLTHPSSFVPLTHKSSCISCLSSRLVLPGLTYTTPLHLLLPNHFASFWPRPLLSLSFSSVRLPPLQSSRLFLESVLYPSFSDILPPTLTVSFSFPPAWQSLEQWIISYPVWWICYWESSPLRHEHMNVKHNTYIHEVSSVYGIRKDGNYIKRSLSGAKCSHGDLNRHLNTSQLTMKRMRNWPLLPLATEVKQRRKKERKFILSIWGRKGRGRQQGGVRNTVHASRTDRRWKRQVLDRERHKAYELVQRLCHTTYNL